MTTDNNEHFQATLAIHTGSFFVARPSMGSWISYGLGTENQNLPGFVVLCPGGYPIQESQNWQAGFLPGVYAGTYIDPQHEDLNKLIEHVRPGAAAPRPTGACIKGTSQSSTLIGEERTSRMPTTSSLKGISDVLRAVLLCAEGVA